MTTFDSRISHGNVTNVRDEDYDLVSVLYHALEAARTYATYVQDANSAGDQELAQFFQQCQQHESEHADRAKQLLEARVTQHAQSNQPANQAPTNRQPTADQPRTDPFRSDPTAWSSNNPASQSQTNWQPTADEPRTDETLPDPSVWPPRSFDE